MKDSGGKSHRKQTDKLAGWLPPPWGGFRTSVI